MSCHISFRFHWYSSELPVVTMAQWVGQPDSDAPTTGSNPSIYLYFSNLLKQFRTMKIAFCLLLSKLLFLAVSALWNKLLTFAGTLFFHNIIINIISKITTIFLLLPLIVFPGIIFQSMQVQSMPSTGKYSQRPKDHFYGNFWYREIRNSRRKTMIPPHIHRSFWYQKLSATQKIVPYNIFRYCQAKGPLTNFYRQTKKLKTFRHLFVMLTLWFKIFAPD